MQKNKHLKLETSNFWKFYNSSKISKNYQFKFSTNCYKILSLRPNSLLFLNSLPRLTKTHSFLPSFKNQTPTTTQKCMLSSKQELRQQECDNKSSLEMLLWLVENRYRGRRLRIESSRVVFLHRVMGQQNGNWFLGLSELGKVKGGS